MTPVVLDDRPLTLCDVESVARRGAPVTVSPAVLTRLHTARSVVMRLAYSGPPIYGLNSALGANTGRPLAMDPDAHSDHTRRTDPANPAMRISAAAAESDPLADYQRNAIRARSVGVGTPFATDVVRAMMFARLAGMRVGGSGISPAVFEALMAMLNAGVHPAVPRIGSIGVGDLAPLSALALPLIGEGFAEFHGTVLPGAAALAAARIALPELGPKDGVSLISSNAATVGAAALMLHDAADALAALEHSAALACEGFRANLSPLDPRMQQARPAPGQDEAATRLSALLAGSALWQPGAARRVQDPLSFRCIAPVHGAALAAWNEARAQVELELNCAADSPLVLASGEMLSNGNFHIPALAIALEALGLGLTQCAAMSLERSQKLLAPAFTDLPLHLTRHGPAHSGFATVQKTLVALYNRIRHLANPACLDFLPVSEGIEDHAPMAMSVVEKTAAILEPLQYIAAVEALIAAQAVDLREPGPRITLGQGAARLYAALRAQVPTLGLDRPQGPDIETAARVLRVVADAAR